MKDKEVLVNDKMQKNFSYFITENTGHNFHPEFRPELSPKQMLEYGVFGGKYMTDCINEFPNEWFENANKLYIQNKSKDFKKLVDDLVTNHQQKN